MGVLYLALDPAIGLLVALKVLRVQGEEMRKRFEREARMIGRFQHPNIVTVYDVGLHEGQPFIAMEYIPGETLAEKILRQEPLHLSRRLEFIEELCDGLAYAHQRGVVHRDVKPANLIVHRESGRLKILDFGIARPTVKDTGITQLGTRLGTPRYMAPEQVQGFPVDQRTDVFAVGLVLYEALAYQPAFPGDEGQLVAYRITHESPLTLTRGRTSTRSRADLGRGSGDRESRSATLPGLAGDARGPHQDSRTAGRLPARFDRHHRHHPGAHYQHGADERPGRSTGGRCYAGGKHNFRVTWSPLRRPWGAVPTSKPSKPASRRYC